MPFKNNESPSAIRTYGGVSINPSNGSVSAETVDAQSLSVAGVPIETMLSNTVASMPRGAIARWVLRHSSSMQATAANPVIFEGYVPTIPGRTYTLNNSVINFETETHVAASFQVIYEIHSGSARNWNPVYQAPFNGWYNPVPAGSISFVAGDVWAYVKITLGVPTDKKWRVEPAFGSPSFWLSDEGIPALTSSVDISTFAAGAPVTTPTSTTTHDSIFYATDSANYVLANNARTHDYPNLLMQSSYSTLRAGFATFANSQGTGGHPFSILSQSNVTIEAASIVIGEAWQGKNVQWYYQSGGTGRLYYHGAQSFGNTTPGRTYYKDIEGWKPNTVLDMGINDLIPQIRSGAFQGVCLSGEGRQGQYTFHGQFPSRPKLWARYTVTT